MATRSMPMVPSLPMVRASSILVPTPSVPATSTGSLSFGSRSAPPKPPSPPSTNGCFVLLSRCFMRSTARLPASTSTPASLYVNPWSSAIVLPRRCDGASLRRTSPPPPALQSAARVSSRLAGRGRALLEAHLAHGVLLGHGDGVVAVEAGAAELAPRQAGAGLQTVEREVVEAGGADMVAHLIDRLVGGDELGARGHVDAVVAGILDRRRADAQVHLFGAGAEQHVDQLARGVAAHDGVVDDHQAFAADHGAQRIELHADAHLAQLVVGLDLADEIGADDVEPGGLAADHGVSLVAAEAQRTHAVGVAEADQSVARHDRCREGAADLGDGRAHGAEQVALGLVGDERRDHLGVGGAGELDAPGDERVPQLGGVHQVAVVAQGDHLAVAAAHQRLRVLPVARARRGVEHVADGVLAAQALEHLLVEDLADETQIPDDRDLAVVGHGDAGALLAAVLQGVEAEKRQARDVAPRRMDAEDATAVMESIVVHGARPVDRQASRCGSDS